MKKLIKKRKRSERGVALFVAMIVMGTIMLIAAGIVSIAVRQTVLSHISRESQQALYAANSGLECALYWDIANPIGFSAFSTSTSPGPITCNGSSTNSVGGSAISTFSFNFSPDPYCVSVTVGKNPVTGTTTIESLGYNTCDASHPRRVERAVRATY